MEYINRTATEYSLPSALLYGVFTLETTYRRWYHRTAENILVVAMFFLNRLTGKPIRNFTIGCCQIGLATILTRHGHPKYRHSISLGNLSFEEFKVILYGMTFKASVECCAWTLSQYYADEMIRTNDLHTAIRNVGELFNGSHTYGILLEHQFFETTYGEHESNIKI